MGTNISQLERDIGTDFPANEHYFGLVNVSPESEIFFNVLILTFFLLQIPFSSAILVIRTAYFKLFTFANLSGTRSWSTNLRIR